MAKYKLRTEKFLKQTLEGSIKTFGENGKDKFFQLKKCQNEYYPYNLNLI